MRASASADWRRLAVTPSASSTRLAISESASWRIRAMRSSASRRVMAAFFSASAVMAAAVSRALPISRPACSPKPVVSMASSRWGWAARDSASCKARRSSVSRAPAVASSSPTRSRNARTSVG